MSRAKVIFTDGFHISPTVETVSDDLRDRIGNVVKSSGSPAEAITVFVIQSTIGKHNVTIHNTPEGRTFGGTVASIMQEGFWPGTGAGVFLVWVNEKRVEYWGGDGFDGTPEYTHSIPQSEAL